MKGDFTAEQVAFGDRLVLMIERTFFHAYHSRANGMSEDELLIDYDIEAAAYDVNNRIAELGRKTIKAAVTAVDSNTAYAAAHHYLADKIKRRVQSLVRSYHTLRLPQSFKNAVNTHAVD